jgi:flagellar protein FlaF
MHSSPLQAYQAVEKISLSGRETEARILTQAALMLKECQENWDARDRRDRLDKALRFNQRIWSIFQAELVQQDNPLPKKLRIDLLRLSGFVDKRIFEVLAHPTPEKLSIIIDINQNIAAGLRSKAE